MDAWGEMKRANLIDEFTEILNYKASYNIVLQELYVLEFFAEVGRLQVDFLLYLPYYDGKSDN